MVLDVQYRRGGGRPQFTRLKSDFFELETHGVELAAEENEVLNRLLVGAAGADWGGGTRDLEEIRVKAAVSGEQLHHF